MFVGMAVYSLYAIVHIDCRNLAEVYIFLVAVEHCYIIDVAVDFYDLWKIRIIRRKECDFSICRLIPQWK